MGDLFRRLGAAGLSLVAAALIFGFLAGVIVLNRNLHPAVQISAQQRGDKEQENGAPEQAEQEDQKDEQGGQKDEQGGQKEQGDPEDSHASKARITEPDAD